MRRPTALLASLGVAALGLVTAPAAHAGAPVISGVTISATDLNAGNALTTGAQVTFLVADATTSPGGTVTAVVGNINYDAGDPAVGYQAHWFGCPSRNTAIGNCTEISTGDYTQGNAAGKSFTYTPKSTDVGKFIRFRIEQVVANQVNSTSTSSGATDVQVYPALATSTPPTATGLTAGGSATVSLKAWSQPSGSTFSTRTYSAWVCSSANAGQTAAYTFDANTAGCTAVKSGANAPAQAATAQDLTLALPADSGTKVLVVQDILTMKFGASNVSTTQFDIRSGALAIAGASPSASPSPTASAAASDFPNPTPSASTIAVTTLKAAVTVPRTFTRGHYLKVVVTTNNPSSIGEATAAIRVKPTTTATVKKRLRMVEVINGAGQRKTYIPKTFPRGTFYVTVRYVDDTSKKVRYASAPITIK